VGKTEMLNNIIGYYVEHDPAPTLLILPTLEMGTAWSKDRFAPMIRDTPSLRGKVTDAKAKDSGNTILHKTFPGGHITIAGANSPASLASRPVKVVLFDEVDRFPPSAGTEGDPVKLGTKRAQTFWNRKIFHTSTPTVKGVSRIESLWEESDQRRFYVPCPICQHQQTLKWASMKWDKTPDGNGVTNIRYECESCQAELHEEDKNQMISQGVWISEHPERVHHRGFHLNELYSPWSSWEHIVESFYEAKKRPETLKVWINTTLGESWEDDESYSIPDDVLASRVETYEGVPEGAYLLTAGIDVQDDRIEAIVVGWGEKEESWVIDYQVFYGSPSKIDVWALVDGFLQQRWKHALGPTLRIVSACIDSGGHFTQNVYGYAKPRMGRRIYPIKGYAGTGRPIVGRPTIANKLRVKVFPIGFATAKELLFARLKTDEPGPGYIHFNENCDTEFFKQLTAERQVTKFTKGFPHKVWMKTRARNDVLDAMVYAIAAYILLNVNMEAFQRNFMKRVETLGTRADGDNEVQFPARHRKIRYRNRWMASTGMDLKNWLK